MDSEIGELFEALKRAGGQVEVKQVSDEVEANGDILSLDNGEEKKQQMFDEIEANLRELPRLHNEFDGLSQPKSKPRAVGKLKDEKTSVQKDWFEIPKMSDGRRKEVERDLLLLKHRAALDPKRHYKKQKWVAPERIAIGTIIEDKSEFFSSRLTNKQRKSTMLESLMADDDSNRYFKRKYNEIQKQKTSGKKAHYKKTKQMRQRR